jgi:hypothetical protein
MFIEAATGVADQVAPDLLKQGLLYPLQADILETEIQTAARVAKLVFDGDWLACHVPLIWSRAFVATSTSPYTPKRLRRRKQRDAGCRNALVVFDGIRLRHPAR